MKPKKDFKIVLCPIDSLGEYQTRNGCTVTIEEIGMIAAGRFKGGHKSFDWKLTGESIQSPWYTDIIRRVKND